MTVKRDDRMAASEPADAAGGPVSARYEADVALGEIHPDPAQRMVVRRLDRLADVIARRDSANDSPQTRSGGLRRLLARAIRRGDEGGREEVVGTAGLYIWGGVGRGKSMLMDMFHEEVAIKAKRRVHFHEFMAEVHSRLKHWREAGEAQWRALGLEREAARNPVRAAAAEIARDTRLLCFDELQVTNIADASVLGLLLGELAARGVTIVATSNRPPGDLYKDGLNRDRFLPTIAWIERSFEVIALDGPTDYRFARFQGLQTYLTPVDETTTEALRRAFYRLTDREVEDAAKVPSDEVVVAGRTIFVPKAARGVAVFSFKRLCASPYGAADYLAIAHRYHTVIVVAIPQMGPERRDWAARFITMIDVFYENGVKLLCSAEVPPEELHRGGEVGFAFQRTVSRLYEMQTESYLARGHGLAEE